MTGLHQARVSEPRISVVTVCYNAVQYVRDALDSVLGQDYPNLEYIVLDGGSTDGTREILVEYSDRLSYWRSEKDDGQTDALADGLDMATGDIMCWLNADDMLEPRALRTVSEWFARHPDAEFMFGDATWIDGEGLVLYERREIPFIRWIWLYAYNYIPQPSAFWTRSLYERVGGLDRSFRLAMDSDLFIRFAHSTKVHHAPYTLSRFRQHGGQRTQVERMAMDAEDTAILSRELGRTPSQGERIILRAVARTVRYVWRSVLKPGSR